MNRVAVRWAQAGATVLGLIGVGLLAGYVYGTLVLHWTNILTKLFWTLAGFNVAFNDQDALIVGAIAVLCLAGKLVEIAEKAEKARQTPARSR